jgi:uncharacterized protein YeaO (DUF488 family)
VAAELSPSQKWVSWATSQPWIHAGARHVLEMLAALSPTADFSIGCYCENEQRCHRSLLRDLLRERGAKLAR